MEKKKQSLHEVYVNNIYAVRLTASASKSRVIHSFFGKLIGNLEWVFFSGFFMRYIVNRLEQGKEFSEIFAFILICGAVFFLFAIYQSYVENVAVPLAEPAIYGEIYEKIYEKARNVELRCYEDPDFYNQYTMAADHAVERVTAITDNIWGVVTGIMASFLVLWTMYRIDPVSVLFVFCPLIGNFLFGNLKNKFEYMRYQEEAPKDKVLNYVNRVLYLPDYAKEIRLSEVFRLLKRQYNEATDEKSALAGKYAWRIGSMNVLWHFFTFTVMFEGVLLFAIYKNLVIGSMSLADLTVMSSLMVAATWILIGLFNSVMETMKNGLFICNLRTFLVYEEKIPEDQDGILPSKELESLEFENVSFSYKEEETIQGLSFRITHGEKIALVGHNGAGKTTIIKLMLRLYDPAEGTIRVNGIDIRKYNLRAYRELFATAFQDYQLFGVTIRENILMGKHPEKEEQLVAEVLKKVGMYEKVAALSKGIDSVVTREFADDGVVFSGGEGQKIAVARAFAKESPIRIFDEPSSALDPIAEY